MFKKKNLIFIILFLYIVGLYTNIITDKSKYSAILEIINTSVYLPMVYFSLLLFGNKYLKNNKYKGILFSFIILIIPEILSKYISGLGTYDVLDLLGYVVGALFTLIIIRFNIIIHDEDKGV